MDWTHDFEKKIAVFGKVEIEVGEPRRVALMLDLEWPYKRHASIFAGTQRYAEAQNWHSIIDEYVHDTLKTSSPDQAPYDGIIARANPQLASRAADLGIPVVNVWLSSPAWSQLPGVYTDVIESGRLQAEHLLARGLNHFAAIAAYKNRGQEMQLRAFRRSVEVKGGSCVSTRVPQSLARSVKNWRAAESTIAAWMESWELPIGVMVPDESLGRLIVQMCHQRSWRVPQDVAMIAGQNEETLCEFPRPSLTSMEFGYDRIGFESAKLLQRMMNGEAVPNQPNWLAPQGLIVRASTDFFAVEDELVGAALDFIAQNSHRRIGQHDVARAVHAECRTLQSRFRKALDRPIVAEIRRVRLERAKRELTQSKRPLNDIARDVGFGGAARMREVFLRETGATPSDYRKLRQRDA